LNDSNYPKQLLSRIESLTGKPILVQADERAAGHAALKLAKNDQVAHVLLYKPIHESELPYLLASQCLLTLRTLEADDARRFDLTSKPIMHTEVPIMIREHWVAQGNPYPLELLPQIAAQFSNGLGLQLRSMPIALRVEQVIFDQYPSLQPMQKANIDRQLQESMQALSPTVKAMAPRKIIEANVSMSTAFAKFWSNLRNDPTLVVPFHSAGYSSRGDKLLSIANSIPDSPDDDRQLVDAWAKELGLDEWFETIPKQL